jgi:hypothetical protein
MSRTKYLPNFLAQQFQSRAREGVKFHYRAKKKALATLQLLGRKKTLGNDLLSHTLVCSTIGDEELDF